MAQPMDPRDTPTLKPPDPHTSSTGSCVPRQAIGSHVSLSHANTRTWTSMSSPLDPPQPSQPTLKPQPQEHISLYLSTQTPAPSGTRSPTPLVGPRPRALSPGSPSLATGFLVSRNLSHHILTVHCPNPGAPTLDPRSPRPSHWIPEFLYLHPESQTLRFDYWIPTFLLLHPQPSTHRSQIPSLDLLEPDS